MLNVFISFIESFSKFMYGLTNLCFDLENKKITRRDGLGTILFI